MRWDQGLWVRGFMEKGRGGKKRGRDERRDRALRRHDSQKKASRESKIFQITLDYSNSTALHCTTTLPQCY
eukprot:scaffold2697_cov204-Chaetoceros_neogracile.AAC.2